MADNNITNYKSQETTFYNGKLVTIISVGNEYVTIKDEITGLESSIPKSELAKTSVYSYQSSPEYIEKKRESKTKIEKLISQGKEYETQQQAIRKEKKGLIAWLNNFFRKYNVVSRFQLDREKRSEVEPNYQKRWSLAMLDTQLGNAAVSAYNAATREAYNMRYLG